MINTNSICPTNAVRYTPHDKQTMVQVMAFCLQARIHNIFILTMNCTVIIPPYDKLLPTEGQALVWTMFGLVYVHIHVF